MKDKTICISVNREEINFHWDMSLTKEEALAQLAIIQADVARKIYDISHGLDNWDLKSMYEEELDDEEDEEELITLFRIPTPNKVPISDKTEEDDSNEWDA